MLTGTLSGKVCNNNGVVEGEEVAVDVNDEVGVTAMSYHNKLKSHHPKELEDDVTAMKYEPPEP